MIHAPESDYEYVSAFIINNLNIKIEETFEEFKRENSHVNYSVYYQEKYIPKLRKQMEVFYQGVYAEIEKKTDQERVDDKELQKHSVVPPDLDLIQALLLAL